MSKLTLYDAHPFLFVKAYYMNDAENKKELEWWNKKKKKCVYMIRMGKKDRVIENIIMIAYVLPQSFCVALK